MVYRRASQPFCYCAGGLVLASNIDLDGLVKVGNTDADFHFTFETGEPPHPHSCVLRWPGRYGLELHRLNAEWLMTSRFGAAFQVSGDGRQIVGFCVGGQPTAVFNDILVRRVLPRVATLRGRIALHASAVGKHGRALVLLGPSKAGKSTIAAALALRHSWDILSDDICVLDFGSKVTVAPMGTGVCLWPDSQKALDFPADSCRAMPAYPGKIHFEGFTADSIHVTARRQSAKSNYGSVRPLRRQCRAITCPIRKATPPWHPW